MNWSMWTDGGIGMRKVLTITGKVVGTLGKVLLAGALLIGTFVMNCIGALICAIDR